MEKLSTMNAFNSKNSTTLLMLAIFDVIGAWFHEKNFSGCMFINASAEFAAADNPHHIISAEHKRLVRSFIQDIATQAKAQNPEELSKQLNLLIEGAIVDAHVSGDKKAAARAKKMAEVFVDMAIA
mgnify:CR=1 FL=1